MRAHYMPGSGRSQALASVACHSLSENLVLLSGGHGDCPDFRGGVRENGSVPLWVQGERHIFRPKAGRKMSQSPPWERLLLPRRACSASTPSWSCLQSSWSSSIIPGYGENLAVSGRNVPPRPLDPGAARCVARVSHSRQGILAGIWHLGPARKAPAFVPRPSGHLKGYGSPSRSRSPMADDARVPGGSRGKVRGLGSGGGKPPKKRVSNEVCLDVTVKGGLYSAVHRRG